MHLFECSYLVAVSIGLGLRGPNVNSSAGSNDGIASINTIEVAVNTPRVGDLGNAQGIVCGTKSISYL